MKTLVALVDFSDVTEAVVETTGTLASALDAEVFILHVAPPDPDFVGYKVGPQTVRDGVAHDLKSAHKQLGDLEGLLNSGGVKTTSLLIQGPTVEKALQVADRLRAGMIVIGSHGHGALHNALLGSVAEGVVRKATCPVLVVPARKGGAGG